MTGFKATTGYDEASGLGSVDANQLVNHWNDLANTTPTLTLTVSPATLAVAQGANQTATVNVAVGGSFNSAVTLTVTGAPSGVTATLSTAKTAAPGSGSSTSTVTVAKTAALGTSTLTITGSGATLTSKASVQLTITAAGTFTITPSAALVSVSAGGSGSLQVNAAAQNGFNSPVTLSITGLPAGVTAAFAPSTVTLPGAGMLTFTVAKTVANTTYSFLIVATGGGVTKTASASLTVTAAPGCTLISNPASVNFVAGVSTLFQVSCGAATNGFRTPLSLVLNGQPANGVVTQILQNYVVPGGGGAPFAVTSLQTAAPGNYKISVTASAPGFSQTLSIPMVITAPNTILLEPAQTAVTLAAGSSMAVKVALVASGGFKSAVALQVAGLPPGVTATLSPSSIAAPGSGTTTVTLTAAKTAMTSGYFVVVASGGGLFNGVPIGITVTHK